MRVFLFLLLSVCNLLQGFEKVTEEKIKLMDKFKPAAHWTALKFDDTFALQFDHPDSFIRMPTCIQVIGGKLYIVDNMQQKVVVFDEQGRFKQKIGQPGKGPGDFDAPWWLIYTNEGFFVNNNNGIEFFGKDFKFKNRVRPFLTINRFAAHETNFYINIFLGYKGRYPLVLKLDRNGGVVGGYYDEEVEKSYLKLLPIGNPLIIKDHLVFIPEIWNTIYVLDKDLGLKKKTKVRYEMLDVMDKCNERELKTSTSTVTNYFGMYRSTKVCNDKIYLLLDLPRLEILQVDLEGNILEHFYNDTDFRFMRWSDFAVDAGEKQTVFYLMGNSVGEDKGRDLSELGVYRMTIDPGKKINK